MKIRLLFVAITVLLLIGCTSVSNKSESLSFIESDPTIQSPVSATSGNGSADIPIADTDPQARKLSEFTDKELLVFVNEHGIEIPYDYRDEERCAAFIREIVTTIEEEPDYRFGYSYPVTMDFAEAIRDATLLFYDSEYAQ